MSIYTIVDKFHDTSKFDYRIVFSPTELEGKWLVVYHQMPYKQIQVLDSDVSIDVTQAVIQRFSVSETKATIVLLDVYDTLFERRNLKESSIIKTELTEEILSRTNFTHQKISPSVEKLKTLLAELYKKDYPLNELQKTYTTTFGEGFFASHDFITEPYPRFVPNSLVFVEILLNGEWIPVFGGFITKINTSLSKMGKTIRSVTLEAVHPFEYLNNLDFVQSFYTGLLMSDILKEVVGAKNELEWQLYLAIWFGQYDKTFREALSDRFRGTEVLQYFSLLELIKFLSHVGNLRTFSRKLSPKEAIENMPLNMGEEGNQVELIKKSIETYNLLIEKFSPLKYFAQKEKQVFAEYEDLTQYVLGSGEDTAPNDTAEYLLQKVKVKENEFKVWDRLLPFRFYLDPDIVSGCNNSTQDCTEFVKQLYKGVLSVSFSYFIESKNKAKVKNLISEISSATMLEFFNLPNGSQLISYPAFYKDISKSGVVVTMKEISGGASLNHSWDVTGINTVTTTFVGQDYINISDEVVKRALYWGIYIDPISTVRYGLREYSAPTIYAPVWGIDEKYRDLVRTFLRAYQMSVNSKNFTSDPIFNNLLLPDLLYRVSQPVFVSGIDWIYTFSGYNLTLSPGNTFSTKINLSYGIPLSMYNEIQLKGEEPVWKIIQKTLSDQLKKAHEEMQKNDDKSLSTPVYGVFRRGKIDPTKPTEISTLTSDEVKIIQDLSKGVVIVNPPQSDSPESLSNFTTTVQDNTGLTLTSPGKHRVQFHLSLSEVTQAIEHVFGGLKSWLQESYVDFSDFEILQEKTLFGYLNHPAGVTVRGFTLHNPELLRMSFRGSRKKLQQNWFEEVKAESLGKELTVNVRGDDEEVPLISGVDVKVHWDDITYSIAKWIYHYLTRNVEDLKVYYAYHGELGSEPNGLGDFEPPWARTRKAVWVFHACEKFVDKYLDGVSNLATTSNPYITAKYGNVTTVLPSNIYHYNDIFILATADVTRVYTEIIS